MRRQSGFSMIELIIVIVILSVLTAITLPVLQTGFNSYFTARNLADADWQARLAFSRISRDLRDIPAAANITTANSTQLTFLDRNSTSVSYTLSGITLQRNAMTLANGVSTLTFAYYDGTGAVTATMAAMRYVGITLNITQNNTNVTLKTIVNLRNLD